MTPIFLDFESNKAGDLFLAGTLIDGRFSQTILSERLAGLSKRYQLEVLDVGQFVDRLLAQAESRGCAIAGYSEAERQIVLRIRPNASFDYLNMAKAAKRWIKHLHYERFRNLATFRPRAKNVHVRRGTWALCSVARFAGIPSPAMYARGKTTARINAVASALERHDGQVHKLTAVQKAKATKLLQHNEFDVCALPLLYDRIAREHPRAIRRSSGSTTRTTRTRSTPSATRSSAPTSRSRSQRASAEHRAAQATTCCGWIQVGERGQSNDLTTRAGRD